MSLKSQATFDVVVRTTEMHTAGEPLRIVESGFIVPQGKTIVDKFNFLRENDSFRRLVMAEPRGHYDMYGALIVAPDHPDADLAVIFLTNEGYSTMCGHATISLGRYAVDRGLVKKAITYPETAVNIQCPCGLVTAYVQVDPTKNNKTGRVRFQSVPCFVVQTDVELELPDIGKFKVDVTYGGAFYAIVCAEDVGVELGSTSTKEVAALASRIKVLAAKTVPLTHPTTPVFLTGIVFVDTRVGTVDGPSKQLIVFADAAIDRSPCGSGTCARIALMHHRGQLALEEDHVFISAVTDQQFRGKAVRPAGKVEGREAIIVEISGNGFYSGNSTFVLEPEDVIGRGFLVR